MKRRIGPFNFRLGFSIDTRERVDPEGEGEATRTDSSRDQETPSRRNFVIRDGRRISRIRATVSFIRDYVRDDEERPAGRPRGRGTRRGTTKARQRMKPLGSTVGV